MTCSPAQMEANRRNARLSTGPKTPEGKARSRANGLKHGLTGEGIVLPTEDAAEVERRFESIGRVLGPRNDLAEYLVRRVATMTVRVERCVRQETAALSEKVRSAEADFDDRRASEVDRAFAALKDDPAANARRLLRTPEGVDLMIRAWLGIRDDVARPNPVRRMTVHVETAAHLAGRRPDDLPISRAQALLLAVDGNCRFLGAEEAADLSFADRREWARVRAIELIDGEVARLRSYRDGFDPDDIARDRAEAADRALFDPSKEATLARKYEAAAERNLYRALRQLKEVNVAPEAEVEAETAPEELASCLPDPEAPDDPASTVPERPVFAPERRHPAAPNPIPGPSGAAPRPIGRVAVGAA